MLEGSTWTARQAQRFLDTVDQIDNTDVIRQASALEAPLREIQANVKQLLDELRAMNQSLSSVGICLLW
jgi:hypothetical protein